MKKCNVCEQTKTFTEFHKSPTSKDGFKHLCGPCNIQQNKDWRAKNPERLAKSQAKYRQKNQSHLSSYYRGWKAKNWPSLKAYIAARKSRVKKQTPPWVSIEVLRGIYLGCPKGFHVDHIVPINGRGVSGLHVPWNLQYLPAIENLRKSNKT